MCLCSFICTAVLRVLGQLYSMYFLFNEELPTVLQNYGSDLYRLCLLRKYACSQNTKILS